MQFIRRKIVAIVKVTVLADFFGVEWKVKTNCKSLIIIDVNFEAKRVYQQSLQKMYGSTK